MDDNSDTTFATAPANYTTEPDAPALKRKRELVDPHFPRKLLGGYAHFRRSRLSRERERYEELAAAGRLVGLTARQRNDDEQQDGE